MGMPRGSTSTSDDDLLGILQRRWEHSARVTESGWKVARHGFHGLNNATSQRAAQFALRQELEVLDRAHAGFDKARTSALSALKEIDQMPHRLRNANAFVSRLPDELMTLVFAFGMIAFQTAEFAELGLAYALSISAVSHSWRRVALATPLLWTHIVYDYPMVADDIPDFDRFSLYLDRSRSELLDVSITYEPRLTGPLKRLLQKLHPHLQRCRRLELNLSNYTVGLVLPLQGHLRRLETLDVCVSDFSRNVSEQPAVPLRLVTDGHQCRLQSLNLAGPYPFKRSHLNPAFLTRLQYISHGTSLSSISRFAAHFSNLRALELTIISPNTSASTDSYVFPSLQSLSIINVEAFGILRHLEGPSLRHLHLWMQNEPEMTAPNVAAPTSAFPRDAFSATNTQAHPISFPLLRTFSLSSSTITSDVSTATVLAHYLLAHGLLQGVQFSADVLGLDTLMLLAAAAVRESRHQAQLRVIRTALLHPREREVAAASGQGARGGSSSSGSMYQEMAELLTVFIQCSPGIRVEVQLPRRGGGEDKVLGGKMRQSSSGGRVSVPGPFKDLQQRYPRQAICAESFVRNVAEEVDEMERQALLARRSRRREDDEETETDWTETDDGTETVTEFF
ncbi:hypothetical protein DL93DRAFT_2164754 [Clavulina sp. PMI_390]|nr:hypothetical protein DL93DRAFT_2164754 [Clavulina sp. PMI_390]